LEHHTASFLEEIKIVAEREFQQWCETHSDRKHTLPIRGRIYGALVVLSNIETRVWHFHELEHAVSTDPGRFFGDRSIRNHTINHISSILSRHGHSDLAPHASRGELGRTSTGTKMAGLDFIRLIRTALEHVPKERWDEQGNALLSYLYERIFSLLLLYQELGGIEVSFTASESIASYISQLLDAHKTNPGAVLQHIVGAKLEIRFSGQSVAIQHNSSATADAQTGRLGDFEIGSTVFHVTKRATDDHYRKAKRNAENGRKVYMLVPDHVLRGIKDFAEDFEQGFTKKVDVFSIEQFVAQNLDELAVFDKNRALQQLRLLLEKYNVLIETYEHDQSLKIIIPDFGID
jgi:hypothetical protein